MTEKKTRANPREKGLSLKQWGIQNNQVWISGIQLINTENDCGGPVCHPQPRKVLHTCNSKSLHVINPEQSKAYVEILYMGIF